MYGRGAGTAAAGLPDARRAKQRAIEDHGTGNAGTTSKSGSGFRLAKFSIDHPVTILMVFASFMVLGAVSMSRIPVVLTPDVSFPFVEVYVPYPNSTPGQVLESIAKPVEEALSTLPNVQRLQSPLGRRRRVCRHQRSIGARTWT